MEKERGFGKASGGGFEFQVFENKIETFGQRKNNISRFMSKNFEEILDSDQIKNILFSSRVKNFEIR